MPSMPTIDPRRLKLLHALWILSSLGLLLIGLVFTIFPLLSFDAAKTLADSIARDGNFESFTPARYDTLKILTWPGLGFLISGVFLAWKKKSGLRVIERGLVFLNRVKSRVIQDFREMCSFLKPLLQEKGHVALLGMILTIAVVNSARFLNRPMQYDEAYTFNIFASRPLFRIISDYSLPNNHIFHSILVHVVYKLFGNQPWLIRLPAFIAGMLLIPAGYLTGRVFFSADVALLGAGLIAFFSVLVDFAVNARGYTIIGLITLLLLILGEFLKSHRNPTAWGWMILLSALGLYTVPTMIFPLGSVGLWLFLSWAFREVSQEEYNGFSFLLHLIWFGLLSAFLTLLLYAPVFIVSGYKSVSNNAFVRPLKSAEFLYKLTERLKETWQSWNNGVSAGMMLFLLIGFGLSLIFSRQLTKQRVSFPLVALFFSIAVVLVRRIAPFDRMWLFAVPVFLIWAAAGIALLYRNTLGWVIENHKLLNPILKFSVLTVCCAVLLVSGNAYQFKTMNKYAKYQDVASFLQARMSADAVTVTTFPDDAQIRYYFSLYQPQMRDAFSFQEEDFDKVFVIVNAGSGQTVDAVLEQQKFPLESVELSSAMLILQEDGLNVFELERR